jgi:hypothetical protein
VPDGPDELERRRAELYAELGQVGEFRRGSLNEEICAARPVLPGEAAGDSPPGMGGEKDGRQFVLPAVRYPPFWPSGTRIWWAHNGACHHGPHVQ